jgi:two-component system sensor histidine kinase KdpD
MGMDNTTHGMPDWLLACLQKALGHDLPNQLVALQGFLQLLRLEEAGLTAESRDYLERATGAAMRCDSLVRGLADLVRSVRTPETPGSVHLEGIVHEAVAEVKQGFADRLPQFYIDILIPVLKVPPNGFRRVLSKLLRQAVLLADTERPIVRVSAREATGAIELRLVANGPGLGAESRESFFDGLDDRDERATDRLGRLLMRFLVNSYGGTVLAAEEPAGGIALVVTLPRW